MKLKVDVGNRRVKWTTRNLGLQQKREEETAERAHSNVLQHYDGDLKSGLVAQFESLSTPDRVWVSCVSSEIVRGHMVMACESLWGLVPEFLEVRDGAFGLKLGYPDPTTLGVDRWLAMVAARRLVGSRAVIVVDAGTAVTLDFIDANGRFNGGVIFPGLQTMIESLNAKTGKIRTDIGFDRVASIEWINSNTRAAVLSGAALAIVNTIDSGIDFHQSCCKTKTKIVITGGDADTISSLSGHVMAHEPDLVLAGIQIVGEKMLT